MAKYNPTEYAQAVIETLRPHFPDLENPGIAKVIGEAIRKHRETPSDEIACILDANGMWRLYAHPTPGQVELVCMRAQSPEANERERDLNGLLDALA